MESKHMNPWVPMKHYPVGSPERAEQAEELKNVLMYEGNAAIYDMVLAITRSVLKSPEQDHDNAVIIRTMTLLFSDEVTLERKRAFREPSQRSIHPCIIKESRGIPASATNHFPEPNSVQSEKMWQQLKDGAAKIAAERKHWEYVSLNSEIEKKL